MRYYLSREGTSIPVSDTSFLTEDELRRRREHSELVAILLFEVCRRLSRKIAMSLNDLKKAITLGMLHDIGYSPNLGYRKARVVERVSYQEDCHGFIGATRVQSILVEGVSDLAKAIMAHGITYEELKRELPESNCQDCLPLVPIGMASWDELLIWADMHAAMDSLALYEARMIDLQCRYRNDPGKLRDIESAKPRWDTAVARVDALLGLDGTRKSEAMFLKEISRSMMVFGVDFVNFGGV